MSLLLSVVFFIFTVLFSCLRTAHNKSTRVFGQSLFLFSLFFFLMWLATLNMNEIVKLAVGNVVVIVLLAWLMFFSAWSKSARADKNDIM